MLNVCLTCFTHDKNKEDKMKYVSYLRVSTKKQEKSGLGIEAQRTTIRNAMGDDNLIREYLEIESGNKNNRIELHKAIEYCIIHKSILVIAKLDRLARSISFIFALKDSGIEFKALDIPELNTLTLGIFATIAQYERELISERTKNALQEKKQQGFKLGTPGNLTSQARLKSIESRNKRAKENQNNKRAFLLISELLNKGTSLRAIAKKLNDNGFKTSQGNLFFATSVKNIYNLYSIA